MTAPADRVTGGADLPGASRATDDRGDRARVDAEFAAIVARNAEPDEGADAAMDSTLVGATVVGSVSDVGGRVGGDRVGVFGSLGGLGAMPAAERCDRPAGSTALRDQVSRIASALFCASGLDAELLAFAIRRAADHHAVDDVEVADGIADEVLRIAVSLAAGR